MIFSILSFLSVAALSAAAHAQVLYSGHIQGVTSTNASAVGSYAGSIVPVLAAGQAGFTSDDIYSYRVTHGASTAGAGQTEYFSLATDNLPVRLTLTTGRFDGKLVYGGGGLATNYTVDLFGRVSIYEYDDANNNNQLDTSEALYLCTTSNPISLASLSANGLATYDTATPTVAPYVLGANSDYVVAVESYWVLTGTAAATDPSVVITVEHVTPNFSGHSATFDYQTVPEPTTAALLGASVLVCLRRRKGA
jgi:hypothetical protein